MERNQTNFDKYLERKLADPGFREQFAAADRAWDIALQLVVSLLFKFHIALRHHSCVLLLCVGQRTGFIKFDDFSLPVAIVNTCHAKDAPAELLRSQRLQRRCSEITDQAIVEF